MPVKMKWEHATCTMQTVPRNHLGLPVFVPVVHPCVPVQITFQFRHNLIRSSTGEALPRSKLRASSQRPVHFIIFF